MHICGTRGRWVKSRADNASGKINMYLNFTSYQSWNGTSTWNTFTQETPIYPELSIQWLLMTWLHEEPGHQQPWYWSSFPNIYSAPQRLKINPDWIPNKLLKCNTFFHHIISRHLLSSLNYSGLYLLQYRTYFQCQSKLAIIYRYGTIHQLAQVNNNKSTNQGI